MLISFIHLLNCGTKYSIFSCTLGLLKIEDATFGKNSFRTQQNIWDGAFFAEKVNGVQPLVIFLDVWFCSKYSYGTVNCFAIRFILDICLGFRFFSDTKYYFVWVKVWIKFYRVTAIEKYSRRMLLWKSYVLSKIHVRIFLRWRQLDFLLYGQAGESVDWQNNNNPQFKSQQIEK